MSNTNLLEELLILDGRPIKQFRKQVVISECYEGFVKKKEGTTRINDEKKPCIILAWYDFGNKIQEKIPLTNFENMVGISLENHKDLLGRKLTLANMVYLEN